MIGYGAITSQPDWLVNYSSSLWTSEQVMNDQFESKIADLIVAKLRNSPAIAIAMAMAMAMARVSRLDLAHFDSQPDSPRLIQLAAQVRLDSHRLNKNAAVANYKTSECI